jgi:cyclic pyranopterin monophosphate synthase
LRLLRLAAAPVDVGEPSPYCHPLPPAHVDVSLQPRRDVFVIEAHIRTDARTVAEMEALHAAVAALTVYDMVKAADKAMTIGEMRVVRETGGSLVARLDRGSSR